MRRVVLTVGVLALAGLGCRNVKGPLESRRNDRPDQDGYSIEEQKRRGRERTTLPDDDRRIGPPTYIDGPDPIGSGTSPAARTRR